MDSEIDECLKQLRTLAKNSVTKVAADNNVRSFNQQHRPALEDSWRSDKIEFLQGHRKVLSLLRTNSPRDAPPRAPTLTGDQRDKALCYAQAVKLLNHARLNGLPFKPATAFGDAYRSLRCTESPGTVGLSDIWELVRALTWEDMYDNANRQGISTEMSLVLGAKRFLEWRHSKYMMGRISEYPVLAALGGEVVNMQQIRAFLRVHLKDYGVLDFDASDVSNPPPVDTTWQQIYFCLRSGYNDEARTVAASSNASQEFAPLLNEWITSGGRVSTETSARASYELDMMLRTYDVEGGAGYEKEKMLVYALVSGSRSLFHRLREDCSPLFDTDEHYHWFMLASIRDIPVGAASTVTHAGLETHTLSDLQVYVNTSGPDGADPLMYPYLLLLSIQLIPAITYMFEEYDIDAAHVSIALADHGVLSEVAGAAQGIGMMDAYGKASHITKQYGSTRFLPHDISMALEYYAQAAAVLGGGRLGWPIGGNVGQQRQRNARLKHVLTELLMRDGGIRLLFGFRGKEGELARFFPDVNERIQFLHEAARQCQEFGLPGKCREIKAEIRRG